MKNYTAGIIGYGKMGKIREEAINATENARVTSVFEPDTHLDDRFVKDPEEMISDPDVDCIFICTPNYLNKDLTIRSLNAGKHVFCEKPPTMTSEEMKEVMIAEESSGKKLMYGFNHRHHCSIKKMKEMVDSEVYGKILWMRGRYGKSVDKSFADNWRSAKNTAGGGILFDQGIHMLDLFLHLGGSFDQVHAFVSNLYWNMDVEDNVFAIMKNSESGMVASLHSTMTQWRHLFSLEVFLEKGYFVLNGLKTSSNSYGEEILTVAKNRSVAPAATWEDEERMQFETDKSWSSEIEHFFAAVSEDKAVEYGSSREALQLMDTLERIYAADKSFAK